MSAGDVSRPYERLVDSLQRVWADGEQTGTVVAYWKTPDERRVYRKFVLDRSADWAVLPIAMASIVHLRVSGRAIDDARSSRRFGPPKMNLSETSRAELDEIARELKGRPRQTLDWKKPCEVLSQVVR